MPAEIIDSKVSVVLLGSFNPRIFHPTWLAENQLIGDEEALAALDPQGAPGEGLLVLHQEITMLRLGWLDLNIAPDRFSAQVNEEPIIRVRDFVLRCFQILEHTPACYGHKSSGSASSAYGTILARIWGRPGTQRPVGCLGW